MGDALCANRLGVIEKVREGRARLAAKAVNAVQFAFLAGGQSATHRKR